MHAHFVLFLVSGALECLFVVCYIIYSHIDSSRDLIWEKKATWVCYCAGRVYAIIGGVTPAGVAAYGRTESPMEGLF